MNISVNDLLTKHSFEVMDLYLEGYYNTEPSRGRHISNPFLETKQKRHSLKFISVNKTISGYLGI